MTIALYSRAHPLRVALAGFGAVGQELARRLTAGAIPEARLAAISARDLDRARAASVGLEPRPRVVPAPELPEHADVVVECATADALPAIAEATLCAGRMLVPVSVGGFALHPGLLEMAGRHGGRIRIATGALPGIDAIRTAAEGGIRSVTLTSRVAPDALAQESWLIGRGFDLATPPTEAVQVFEGSAREAALACPGRLAVAVTLALAGLGLDRTQVRLWADPDVAGAVHEVEVEGEDISLRLTSRERPSDAGPRSSRALAPSIMATLRAIASAVQVGS